MSSLIVRRGDIFYADLSYVMGSELGGIRPVVVIQNNIANRYSPTIIVAAITTQIDKAKLPTHVQISANEYGLNRDGLIILEQIRTLDKKRLKEKIGTLTDIDMKKVDKSLAISVSILLEHNKILETKDIKKELKDINLAIDVLKSIAKKYDINEHINKDKFENKYKNMLENIYANVGVLSNDVKNVYSVVSPLVEKQKIAKGQLGEHATIKYFKINAYKAEEGDDILDKLKIDVIAKDDKYKIFTQVKTGMIGAHEIAKLVKNVKGLDNSYDKEGLRRMACVCADKFPPDGDIIRIRLEKEYEIPIMFIHKYQVLELCRKYKRTVS